MNVIEIVVTHNFPLSELAVILEVFQTAQKIDPKIDYTIRIVSHDNQISSSSGPIVHADPLSPFGRPVHMLAVIGQADICGAQIEPSFVHWIKTRARVAMRVIALTSGASLLARAGLLEGRRIALHWRLDPLELHEAGVMSVDNNSLFIQDRWLWTAVSVSAGVDMLLELLSNDHGPQMAKKIGKELTLGQIRNGADTQHSPLLDLFTGGSTFDSLHMFIRRNIRKRLTLEHLADHCGMSTRTFLRRYREATGTTPAKAIDRLRAEIANSLLAAGEAPSKRLVHVCGFGSEETMRRSIARHFGRTPRQLRGYQGQL